MPEPFYDSLNFRINAAHERGLEWHAWLNPYRAYHIRGGEISEKSIIKTNPELVVKLENGMYWIQGTQDRSLAVVVLLGFGDWYTRNLKKGVTNSNFVYGRQSMVKWWMCSNYIYSMLTID